MAGKPRPKTALVKEALDRLGHLPTRTIARHLVYSHPGVFDSVDDVRRTIRYYLGASGDKDRAYKPKVERQVTMPPTWRQQRTPYTLPDGKWLIISDLHIPFHEPVAVEAALSYGKKQKITGILMNGDMMDCAAVSYWPSSIKRDFDAEIELFIDFLDLLDQEFPKAKKVYKLGNHEHRLPRMMQTRVPELAGLPLASIEAILGLEERGIDTVDFYDQVLCGRLPVLHGHEIAKGFTRAVNPARGLFLKAKSWAMCGHFHTTSEHTERNIRGKLLTCWSIGCLCDLSPEFQSINSWNWGFAIVTNGKNGDFFVENRRILPNGVVA